MNTCNSGMSFGDAAKQFSFTKSTVQYIMEKYHETKMLQLFLKGIVILNSDCRESVFFECKKSHAEKYSFGFVKQWSKCIML